MENEETKLYIPSNVRNSPGIFQGTGKGINHYTNCISGNNSNSNNILLFRKQKLSITSYYRNGKGVVASIAISTTKDDNNLCIVNQIKYMIKFAKMQKNFEYKYFDKWRG